MNAGPQQGDPTGTRGHPTIGKAVDIAPSGTVAAMETRGWISADSHVVEPAEVWSDVPSRWRDRVPRLEVERSGAAQWVVPGLEQRIDLGLARPAPSVGGATPTASVDDLRPGGHDPIARLADQDLDGVRVEVLYPTIALTVYRSGDAPARQLTLSAYNEWLGEFCSVSPNRLLGVAALSADDPVRSVADLDTALQMSPAAVLLPMRPGHGAPDYDDVAWSALFEALSERRLPIAFHSIAGPARPWRGPQLASFALLFQEAQDLLGVLLLGGVLERWPDLQVVVSESDGSWLGHLADRFDRIVAGHGLWAGLTRSTRSPSEMLRDQVSLCFADDLRALQLGGGVSDRRLMWGSDYPHADTTWPDSRRRITSGITGLEGVSPDAIDRFTTANAVSVFGIDPTVLEIREPRAV